MRTFSLTEGSSDKFWHIDVVNDTVTVHYGRNGTKGQVKSTQYAAAEVAEAEAEKLIRAKLRKGYQETASGAAAPPVPAAVSSAAPTGKASPSTVAAAAAQPAEAATPPLAAAPADQASGDATVTTRPLAPAPGVAPAIGDPGDLGLSLSRLEEAALAWGRPLDSYLPEESFELSATEDWVRAHAFQHQEWSDDVAFAQLPFDGIPSPEAAEWWLRWYYMPAEAWRTPSLRDRLGIVRRDLASGQPLPEQHLDYLNVNDFITAAANVALHPSESLLPHYLSDAGAVQQLLGARAAVVPQLDRLTREEALERARLEPDDRVRLRHFALLADPQEYAALFASLPPLVGIPAPRTSPNYYGTIEDRWLGVSELLAPLPDQAAAIAAFDQFRPDSNWLATEEAISTNGDLVLALPMLLATVGAEALPYAVDLALAKSNRAAVAGLVRMLTARLSGPAAVTALVQLARKSRAPQEARAWLVAHPEALAASSAKFTGAETELLQAVVRETLATRPDAFAGGASNSALAGIVAALQQEAATPVIQLGAEPTWWSEAVAAEAEATLDESKAKGRLVMPSSLPVYATAAVLPQVTIEGTRLAPSMVEAVIWSAVRGANAPDLAPRPLVAAVRERIGGRQRDQLGLALLEGWLSSGAETNQRALFVAAGFLGADGLVNRLVPLVRDWPGQSQHQRAVLGLNVLAATGTKAALQGISGIANKSKFKAIQVAANASMATLASLQGITPEQLADQVVPDGGLDERGSRVLSFGPRSFRVTLSPQGKLVVRDLDAEGRPVGKVRTSLPAPNSKDDAEQAATAKAEFSLLRKQLGELAKIQTGRLERAMVSGRTWIGAEHREYLVANPLLNSLIRPLVWEVKQAEQRLLVRVTEDREYLDADEEVVELSDTAVVRLAHPLNLSEAERAHWRQQLADYDLVAPIEQLERAVFTVPDGLAGRALPVELLPQGKIHPGSLVGILERNGWRRGNPADGGVVGFCWLAFPELAQAVIIGIEDGLWTGMIAESGDQRISGAVLVPPSVPGEVWYLQDARETLDWAEVNPLVFSEVQRAFAELAEKMV